MHKKAISLWEQMTIEERFRYMMELDSRYRSGKEIGNGLRNLMISLIRKVEQTKENDTKTDDIRR